MSEPTVTSESPRAPGEDPRETRSASSEAGLRTGSSAESAGVDPVEILRRWTLDLDEERVVSLWMGLAAVNDTASRQEALSRWIAWSGVAPPPGVELADLTKAAEGFLDELTALAHEPERIGRHDEPERKAITRALRVWVRAREHDPAAVLGGFRAVLHSEALGGIAPSSEAERRASINVLRRTTERLSARALVPFLEVLFALEARSAVFSPFTESVLDFLLLEGELHTGFVAPLARMASLPAWTNTVRLGLSGIGRGAVRAARLLAALAAHPEVARELPADVAQSVTSHLVQALSHSRFAVWSRAARAMGRLAGVLPDLPEAIARLLDPPTPMNLRRRAHAALGSIGSHGNTEPLLARRTTLLSGPVEPWLIASLSLGLADQVDDHDETWTQTVRTFAARGGPESWATLLVTLREIAVRHPDQASRARDLAGELRAMAETHRSDSPAEAELVERTLALAGRVLGPEGDTGETTPWLLVAELCARVANDPTDTALTSCVEELLAHTDHAISGALRAITQDHPRTAARAGVMLEEIVDLVVDGDLAVVSERIANSAAREAASHCVDALRTRLLRTVWTGLRRPTPASPIWRRWLLRTAAVLPRIEPAGAEVATRERLIRKQVFDTLAHIADDPAIQQPALQRYVVSAVSDLAEVLSPTLGEHAALTVLAWFAARTGVLPSHARTRRALGQVPADTVDRFYLLVQQIERGTGVSDRELRELGEIVGQRCRLGMLITALANELASLSERQPEAHWSGLPKFDLTELARLADEIKRARDEGTYALTLEQPRESSTAGKTLLERANRLNRSLTTAALKFVDAARRAEIVDHYLTDLGTLAEAIASACGPVLGAPLRAQLARALVRVRSQAAQIRSERSEDVRYIGRLRVLGALGSASEGGMTDTYLAEGPAPGKRVVVKLLPWERFSGGNADAARTLFEREMTRLAAITHPNVVSIIDAGFVEEGAYIAIEYIPGASLESILRTLGPIELRRLAPIVRDVARGLAYLHARGIVHRDIKPGNILVQLDGWEAGVPLTRETWEAAQFIRAVVIDLGIATDPEGTASEGTDGLVGTPGYLAPEIARGLDVVSPAMDVYALAVVVLEALTGVNPFLEGEPDLAAILVRHGTMPLPLDLLPEEAHRPALLHLLAEAGKLDPRQRPTMKDFLARWIAALR